jgi:eukaryotic-like serine/threonine-protein kinase
MIGQTVLHYKIIEKLGEGGMGEVYKAQDTKLDRFVALKFLPSQMSASEEDKTRFIQEAKAASAMNHPNVCTIYDIQENNGQLFIVMEYVDGKTLKDKKDSLSEKQILEIGIQVAEGLAAAHEKGIVHRDIKPENIMIRKDGIVQIMDFGLAKLRETSGVSRLTKAGTTMGTMGYMSPEQVQGLDVDHRSDIFSLGVVLYELFTGEPPFKGVHETAIMYEIVNVDPSPISTVKEGIDPELDRIILECLEKDKDERCQSAKELAKDLRKVKKSTGHRKSRVYNVSDIQSRKSEFSNPKSSGSVAIQAFNKTFELNRVFGSAYLLWPLIIVLILAVIYLLVLNGSSKQNNITSVTSIDAPPGIIFTGGPVPQANFGISHDGKSIVFVGADSVGNFKLWIRQLNSESAKPLDGTDNAWYPFWSYDDKSIGYFVPGKLMKIDLNTGLSSEVCPARMGRGGNWNQNNEIVFAPDGRGGLYLVSSNGGVPKEIIKTDPSLPNESLRFPFFLPDGKHFLYSIEKDYYGATPGDVIKVGSINSDVNKVLMAASTNAQFAGGYLFFTRQSALLCQQFNLSDYTLHGNIKSIAENINYDITKIKASYSVSPEGNLVYQHNSPSNSALILMNSKGSQTELPVRPSKITAGSGYFIIASLSPDLGKILYPAREERSENTQLWEYDLKSKLKTKITFGNDPVSAPYWSPDGKMIAYTSGRNVYIENADGTGNRELIYKCDSAFYKVTDDWSSDGTKILINDILPNNGNELVIINIRNKSINRFITGGKLFVSLLNGKFSDDMKWLLYASDRSGTFQLYVTSLNKSSGIWQIPTNGGVAGWWINNDKSIIYVTIEGNVYIVNVNGSGTKFIIGTPKFLFSLSSQRMSQLVDVSKDGSLLLGAKPLSRVAVSPLTYVQNWKGLIAKGKK